jgi:transposase-like protein
LDKKQRRKYSGEEKVAILKRHFLNKEAVSDICDGLTISPNQFYRWQKEFFDNGAIAFEKRSRHSENIKFRKLTDKVEKLESKLFFKDQVIAEITEDYVKLKKNFGET